MIDEAVLERLLHDEAETYVPPPEGPDDILLLAREEHRPGRVRWFAAAAVLLVAVVVAPVVRDRVAATYGDDKLATQFADGGGYQSRVMSDTANEPAGDAGSGGAGAPSAPGAGALVDGAQVVRTGEVTVETPAGSVAETLRRAAAIAARHGGYVSASSGETTGDSPNGWVTVRVPVASFDAAVDEAGRLGKVRHSATKGEDVTSQVTDTAARLKSLGTTRAQLQTLMARAKDVGEVLAVQQRLTDVQTQIEQLQARQASLADRTTYGTVEITVTEPGNGAPGRFGDAWHDAKDGFVGGFAGLVRSSGTIAFLLVVGGVLLLAGRKAYRYWVRGVV